MYFDNLVHVCSRYNCVNMTYDDGAMRAVKLADHTG